MKLHARIWPNRAADPAEEDVIERVMLLVADSWTGEREQRWNIEIMAVCPDQQGKGVGKMIVKWGLDPADGEGVCASVVSSKGKEPFYEKCRFHLEDGRIGRAFLVLTLNHWTDVCTFPHVGSQGLDQAPMSLVEGGRSVAPRATDTASHRHRLACARNRE